MKFVGMFVLLGVVLYTTPSAKSEEERDKLNGTWVLQTGIEGNPDSLWSFISAGEMLHVIQVDSGKKIADFKCDTSGVGCHVKIAGKKVTVAMWFNGPKLMQMVTNGSGVSERSFKPVSQGKGMVMELIPIIPAGSRETSQYKRLQLSLQGKK